MVLQYLRCMLPPQLSIQLNLCINIWLYTGEVYLFIDHCNLSANGYPFLPFSYRCKHRASEIALLSAHLTKDIGLVTDQVAVIYTVRLVLISKAFN